MANDKRGGKGFCPFCGSEFVGDRDECPNCGQDIRQYNDDLGPVLDRIQTATNIDMKSPKVRITMSIIIFTVVFIGVLMVLNYSDTFNHESEPEPEPIIEGLVVEVRTNGYVDLTGDFASGQLTVVPLYEPELRFQFALGNDLGQNYYKIMWVVETEAYNKDNSKNPFYSKVTKESSGSSPIDVVVWTNVNVGKFTLTADCYKDDGTYDVYEGYGSYYGVYNTSYSWMYNGSMNTFDYSMSSEEVRLCINYDLTERMDLQNRSTLKDFVADTQCVSDMNDKLRTLYNKNYRYTNDGFADYVLSFVQQCFPDVYDSFNYKVNDYWAYPMETILWGCGDDEDRAILYCALMKDADITAALITLPESTIAGVQLDMSTSFIEDPITVRSNRGMFVVADTSSYLGLGELRPAYTISDDGSRLTFNGTDYGLIKDMVIIV